MECIIKRGFVMSLFLSKEYEIKMEKSTSTVGKTKVLFLITMMICTFILSGCVQKEKTNKTIQSSKLEAITITSFDEDIIEVTDSTKIQDIVNVINNAKRTKDESTQDVPDVEKYGKITFVSKDDDRILYYYQKNKKWYIEEPYVGIYECSQNLDNYFHHCSPM